MTKHEWSENLSSLGGVQEALYNHFMSGDWMRTSKEELKDEPFNFTPTDEFLSRPLIFNGDEWILPEGSVGEVRILIETFSKLKLSLDGFEAAIAKRAVELKKQLTLTCHQIENIYVFQWGPSS